MVCMLPLFGLMLLLLSVGWVSTIWQTIRAVRAARNWVSTEGETASSEIETMTGGEYRRHYARITYRYEVEGEAFTGKEVYFGSTGPDLGRAEAICDRYPANHQVTVWYDPAKPALSVLERRFDWVNLVVNTALATLVICFGSAMIWVGVTS